MAQISVLLVVCGVSALFSQACCGRVRRIVGGTPMSQDDDQWPFLVSLHFHGEHPYLELQGMRHLCAGTLVHYQWVLTVAHCVDNDVDANLGNASYWTAKAGEYDRTSDDPHEQEQDVVQIIRHPDYAPVGEDATGDLALLKLRQPFISIDGAVGLIGLDRRNRRTLQRWTKCDTAGWGQVQDANNGDPEYGNGTLIPHVVELRMWNHTICEEKYRGKFTLIDDTVLCFGSNRRRDACKGDSGGPLICTYHGKRYLTGITSVGFGCAFEDYPGVFTRISARWQWIRNIIKRNTDSSLITPEWKAL